MPESAPTIGELRKAATVTDDQIDAAVEAYLADPTTGHFVLTEGVVLDLAAAVRAHRPAREALDAPEAADQARFRRGMVRTAIILTRPEKA